VAIAFRDSSSATNGGTASTTLSIAVPATAVAGDYAVIIVAGEETTPVPTWGSSFTALAPSPAPTRANETINAANKILVSGDLSTSVTVSFTTSRARSATMLVFSGVDPSMVDVAAGGAWTGGTTGTAPGVTTTQADDLLIAAYALQSNTQVSMATPTGFTAGPTAVSTSTGSSLSTFYKLDQAAVGATGNVTSTYTGSMNGVGLLVAVKLAAGVTLTGAVGSVAVAAPAGSIGGTVTLAGPVASVAVAAPAGIISTPTFTAPAAGVSVLAPVGSVLGAPNPLLIGQIGDSLTYQDGSTGPTYQQNLYNANGWTGATVNGIIGRYLYNAGDTAGGTPAVLDAWSAAGFNPRDIVVALGTNDTLSSLATNWLAALNSFRSKVGTDLPGAHRFWFVTIVADSTGGQGFDGAIGTKGNTVADYNNFLRANLNGTTEQLLDWNAYVKANNVTGWWENDANHVHMTTSGYTARDAFLTAQMAQLSPLSGGPATVAVAAPAGSMSAGLTGAVATVTAAAPAGTINAGITAPAATVTVAAPAGSTSATLTGQAAAVTAAAPAGTVTTALMGQAGTVATAAPAGKTATAITGPAVGVTAAALAGTIGSALSMTGTVATVAAAAPAGAITSTTTLAGTVATVAVTAPVGSSSSSTVLAGMAANVTVTAPGGTITTTLTLTGTPGTVAAAAPAGTVGTGLNILGPAAGIAVAAPVGTASHTLTMTGTSATVGAASPAGQFTSTTAITGQLAAVTVAASPGVVASVGGIVGPTAPVAVFAPAGTFDLGPSTGRLITISVTTGTDRWTVTTQGAPA
jgi:hypothetical protein